MLALLGEIAAARGWFVFGGQRFGQCVACASVVLGRGGIGGNVGRAVRRHDDMGWVDDKTHEVFFLLFYLFFKCNHV